MGGRAGKFRDVKVRFHYVLFPALALSSGFWLWDEAGRASKAIATVGAMRDRQQARVAR